MKRALKITAALTACLTCLCVTALAAEEQSPEAGIYAVTKETGYESSVIIVLQKADTDSTEVQATTVTINGKNESLYPQAEKLKVTYTNAEANAQYLILGLNGGEGIPTEENIVYIDQIGTAGTENSVEFTLYPRELEVGKTYSIYLSSNASTGITAMEKVAQFQYYMPYKLGDVDEDDEITATDARYALVLSVGSPITPKGIAWTENQRLAAEVDGEAPVTAADARYILEAAVGKRHF